MPLFGLIDANNFYVSCERIFRPDLLNKPVGVLSNSNEVKALGTPMGAPLFKCKKLIEATSSHHFFIKICFIWQYVVSIYVIAGVFSSKIGSLFCR